MGKSRKGFMGIIYKSIHKYAKTKNYERALALNLDEFSYTLEDEVLADYGVLSAVVVLVNGTDPEDSIDGFEIKSIRLSCTTQIFEGTKEVLEMSEIWHTYELEVTVNEIAELHKETGLFIHNDINYINFNVNFSDIKTTIVTPIWIAPMRDTQLKSIVDCGLAGQMLNVAIGINDCSECVDKLKYLYYTYKGDLTLYIAMEGLDPGSLMDILNMARELNGSLKTTKKFSVILAVKPDWDIERNLYLKDLIEDLVETFKIVDELKVSYDSDKYLDLDTE